MNPHSTDKISDFKCQASSCRYLVAGTSHHVLCNSHRECNNQGYYDPNRCNICRSLYARANDKNFPDPNCKTTISYIHKTMRKSSSFIRPLVWMDPQFKSFYHDTIFMVRRGSTPRNLPPTNGGIPPSHPAPPPPTLSCRASGRQEGLKSTSHSTSLPPTVGQEELNSSLGARGGATAPPEPSHSTVGGPLPPHPSAGSRDPPVVSHPHVERPSGPPRDRQDVNMAQDFLLSPQGVSSLKSVIREVLEDLIVSRDPTTPLDTSMPSTSGTQPHLPNPSKTKASGALPQVSDPPDADPQASPLPFTPSVQDMFAEEAQDFPGFEDCNMRDPPPSPSARSECSFQSCWLLDSPTPSHSQGIGEDDPHVFKAPSTQGHNPRGAPSSAFSPINPSPGTSAPQPVPQPTPQSSSGQDKTDMIKAVISLLNDNVTHGLHGPQYPTGKTERSVPKHPSCLHKNECPLYNEILSVSRALRNSGALDQLDLDNVWLPIIPSSSISFDDSSQLAVFSSPEISISPENLLICVSRMAFMNATDPTHALPSSQDFLISDSVLKNTINNFASSFSIPFFKDEDGPGPTSHPLVNRMWSAMNAYADRCALGLDSKIEINKSSAHILPRGDTSFPLKFFRLERLNVLAAKKDLCPEVGKLPSKLIEEDLKARSALISALSGSLCLDLLKSSTDSSSIHALADSTARFFFPAIQVLLRDCVRARMKLRASVFSHSVREKHIVKNLIRENIITDSLFPPGSLDKIQSQIGSRSSVNFFLSPSSSRRSSTFFRAKSSSSKQSTSYRKTPYTSRDKQRRSYRRSSPSSSNQTSHTPHKSSSSQETSKDNTNPSSSRGSYNSFRGSSKPPTRGRGRGSSN